MTRPTACVAGMLAAFTACGGGAPVAQRSGILPPGGAIVVQTAGGDIDAYAPARNEPQDRYAIQAFRSIAAGGGVSIAEQRMVVRASAPAGTRFLVRAPKGTSLDLQAANGNINVQDFDGVVNARTGRGDIKMLIPGYGNAFVQTGNVSVIFADDHWNGTLHFGAGTGNVEIYVNETAKARIRMHTDDGTVFSDFPLTGSSSGTSETIDAAVNGGGPRGIDVEVHHGSIRVMQLKPQV